MPNKMEAARDAAWQKDKRKYRYDDTVTEPTIAMPCYHDGFDAGWDARGSQWVAVSERLPEFNVDVLCRGIHFSSNPQMGGGYALVTRRIEIPNTLTPKEKYVDDNDFRMAYVTHWMPIPPYTADSGQEGE